MENFSRDRNTRPHFLPPQKSVCRKKQQLELDMEQQTGSKLGKEYVNAVYCHPQMGMTVVIRHEDGYTTHYSSLADEVAVKAGDKVKLGQTIGTVGNTALMESALPDHVCFRVTLDGETIDPAEFLN